MTPELQIFGFVLLFNLPLHFREIKASTTDVYAGGRRTQTATYISASFKTWESKSMRDNGKRIKLAQAGRKSIFAPKVTLLKRKEERNKVKTLSHIKGKPTVHQGDRLPEKLTKKTSLLI